MAYDTIRLYMSQDEYKGDALFKVRVDGVQYGDTHNAARKVPLTIESDFRGFKNVEVEFVNDHWEGTPATDRNLYIRGVEFNGEMVAENIPMYSNGTKDFDFA